ncbi:MULTISPECIES: hypothetical protein [unclassified Streptomyces]|uniref:hypothetical protein n=1 Tax=unclassified Streptomyces TaxID=2593676 RepID=UPI0023662F3C|nr:MULTISPECIES: hypothetical protein [unclassified Streptomyces]MDF3141591.1 hypothetical protein [Streptomyces sp. T21Q-yed]WDF38394.1 hypothetical protein PBV52_17110 [Streptomyces sp. T12]
MAVTVRAADRAKALGAEQALETLRRELEQVPRLGVLLGLPRKDGTEVRKTRIEPRAGVPGLAVAYVYTPAPPPPTVAIVAVTPDDGVLAE